jgi:hypothetical protein
LVVIGLRDDAFAEKQAGKALVGIGERGALVDLRNFLVGQNTLALEQANEGIRSRRIFRLLLRERPLAPRKGCKQTCHQRHNKWFHYHLITP